MSVVARDARDGSHALFLKGADAVVLELDQERLDAIVATDLALALATSTSSTRGASYGADFLAGASAAEAIGALVVLGDAKARSLPDELRARITDDPLDLSRLARSLGYVARAFGYAARPAHYPRRPRQRRASEKRRGR